MEYLRVRGIFRGIIPPTNSSEAKNAGGRMYPISSSPLEEFRNLWGIFLTNNKIFYHFLFLIGFDKMAEEKKELDERILLALLPIMLLQKLFKFWAIGTYRIWSSSSLRFESRWNWKSVDYTRVASQYQFPNQPVLLNLFGFNGLLITGSRRKSIVTDFSYPPAYSLLEYTFITILSPRPHFSSRSFSKTFVLHMELSPNR